MAIYFIGDIQGCYNELKALLNQVNFNSNKDELWAAGDLVARGPDSYKTLKFLYSLGNSAKVVLGNHDLHLLAIYAGIKKPKASDLLDELLTSPDIDELMQWLATQPLVRKLPNEEVYLSHAGIPPQWTIKQALHFAKHAQEKLASKDRNLWLKKMYGEKPNNWQQVSSEEDTFRYTINGLTRMRFCELPGQLDFSCKSKPQNAPPHLVPWYHLATEQLKNCSWIFGHWAALMGNIQIENLYALDTGCVWGGHLTLLRWQDKKIFIEPSHKNLR